MWLTRSRLLLVILLATTAQLVRPLSADPPRAPFGHQLPDDLLVLTDVVLSRHVDPPTRQEMLLGACKALYRAAECPVPAHLSRDLSELAGREQLETLLERVIADISAEELQDAAIGGLLGTVPGSPHLMPADEAKVLEQLQGNRYVGIGVQLIAGSTSRPPELRVLHGGPAERAQAQTGDLILEIDGRPVEGLSVKGLVDLVRGEADTVVTLKVQQPRSEPRTLEITRGVVVIPTIQGYRNLDGNRWDFQIPSQPVALVRFREIGASTVHELRQLERELADKKMRALVLDFRMVDGGTIHHATLLADALLSGGTVGQVRTVEGMRRIEATKDCLFRDWPMAVLVHQSTGGMAEWLTAALQDRGRAVIVGDQTPGHGIATEPVPLSGRDAALVLATTLLQRADGRELRNPRRLAEPQLERIALRSGELPDKYGLCPDIRVVGGRVSGQLGGDIALWTAVRRLNELIKEQDAQKNEAPVEAPHPDDIYDGDSGR